jgi:hypothetical protein
MQGTREMQNYDVSAGKDYDKLYFETDHLLSEALCIDVSQDKECAAPSH